jgi:hypothetical protein
VDRTSGYPTLGHVMAGVVTGEDGASFEKVVGDRTVLWTAYPSHAVERYEVGKIKYTARKLQN